MAAGDGRGLWLALAGLPVAAIGGLATLVEPLLDRLDRPAVDEEVLEDGPMSLGAFEHRLGQIAPASKMEITLSI